jgi:diacylglycerol kinase family enzyme
MDTTERRIVVVHNPICTQADRIGRDVFGALDENRVPYADFSTKWPDPKANEDEIRAFLKDGDRVIAAGGDGTVATAARALVGREIQLGALPFGNYNDVSRAHTDTGQGVMGLVAENTPVVDHSPIIMSVNGNPIGQILGSAGLGRTVYGVEAMNEPKAREARRRNNAGGYGKLALEIMKHFSAQLPPYRLNGSDRVSAHSSDIMITNLPSNGGGAVESQQTFYRGETFGLRAMRWNRPDFPLEVLANKLWGRAVGFAAMQACRVKFAEPADNIPLHIDGETQRLQEVREIEFAKTQPIQVLHSRVA